jgi:hypothetical protein
MPFNKISKLSFVFFITLFSTILSAQNDSNQKNENREARKIAFFTTEMDLNSEESQNFWPVVNEMNIELKKIRNKNAHGRMILVDKKSEDLSDKELEEILDARMQIGKEQMDIKIKYHEKFKKVLPIQKLAKFYQATREFKKLQSERKNKTTTLEKEKDNTFKM